MHGLVSFSIFICQEKVGALNALKIPELDDNHNKGSGQLPAPANE